MEVKKIYEDDFVLVIDKPAGLVVNKAASVKGKSLQDIVEERGWIKVEGVEDEVFVQRSGLAHRLDKETSGVLVIAKQPAALKFLLREFKARQVEKEYLALVHGLVPAKGVIEASIQRHPFNKRKFTVIVGGRESVTAYELVKSYILKDQKLSLVRVRPKTGRTHQIRVHFKYLGFPLVGDVIYGGRKNIQRDKKITPRLFLHASRIGFRHPSSKKWVEYQSSLPSDLEEVLDRLDQLEVK